MRTTTLLSLLILSSCVSFSSCTITYWPVGGLSYGSFGPNYTSADDPFYLAQFMHFAVLYINNYSNLLPANVKFQMTYYNTQGDNTQGVIDAFQLADISHVRGVAGGTFSSEVVAEATVLQYFKVPQNSGTASYGGLSDKTQYPYFFRVSYADYGQSIAVLALLKSFGYTEVVVLYSVDDYGIGCRTAFVENAANYSITPTAISIPASSSASADFASVLSQVKATKINVFVVFCQVVQGTPMIIEANTTGLIGSKYVWIVCDTLTYQYQTPSSANPDPSILDGMLGIEEPSGYGPLFDEVWQIYNTLDPNVWWGAGSYVDPGYPSWYTFDSMYVFAVGLAKLLNAGVPIQNITNDLYTTTLFGVNFTGTTGDIAFDANGDRQGAYLIYNWHNKGNNLTNTMYIDANMTYSILAPTYFYGETTVIPPDTDPVCSCLNGGVCSDLGNADNKCICPSGYSGTNCETFTNNNSADVKKIVIAVVIPVVGVMAIVLAAAYSYYRKKRTHLIKSVAEKQKSELPRNDILLGERIGRGASGEVFRGQLRGTDVAIKKFIINGVSNDALDQFTLESSMMCGLRHPNVVLFMGSCCDLKTKEMLLVMEFMNRGSLYDVIHNKKVFLSYELKLHLALQTAQGINFLHQSSPAILHRDIKSHNILLDDKWTARISDFGITIPSTKGGDDHNVGTIYWTAVEVLNGQRYTEKSDCYSFGIVLYELFHSSDPYPGRDAMVVASQVISSGLRPTIDPSKVPYEVRSLMESCWASDPELRPTFKEVVARLKQLTTEHPMLPNSLMQDNVSAPTGTVFLVKTMVENALNMWDSTPRAMAFAMILHNDMLRKSLAKFNGYESSFDDNNSFLVSFADLDSAVKWCLDVQNALANASWPATLKGKGLRVRMALNTGAPNCHITQNAGNIHYFGPVVEKLSKILDSGKNGEILASESVVALLHTRDFGVQVSPFKAYYEILSNSMLKPMPEDVNLGRVTSYDEPLTTPGSTPRANRTPNWVVDLADVSIKTLMGVGPLGECSKVALNNNELVMKMLGYQKLTENDVFMFICYGSILSKLRHQNIAAYYGICIQPKSRSIFQEFMERGSLQSILRNPSIDLPSERKLQFAIDIASGMHYLSLVDDEDISKNRNLKSCNCMVGKNWEVKVADFGLHKVKDVMQTITASVNVAWTAPEQFENDTNVFNHASPVYSFGIILWEILTRKVPFAGVHPTRLVSLTLSGLRPEIPNSCPHPYQNLMERCWDAQPNKRPTWQEILNELHNMREYSKINIA